MYDYCWVCSDYMNDCDYVCDATDEESLMNQIAHHLAEKHDHAYLDEDTKQKIRESMKKTDK